MIEYDAVFLEKLRNLCLEFETLKQESRYFSGGRNA